MVAPADPADVEGLHVLEAERETLAGRRRTRAVVMVKGAQASFAVRPSVSVDRPSALLSG